VVNAWKGLLFAWLVSAVLVVLIGCGGDNFRDSSIELLNVSYDPTRELWREINTAFIPQYEQQIGRRLSIKQSHAGSTSQARAVIDGLEADVVTLAMWTDTNAVSKAGLIAPGWETHLPNGSLPYYSTIVFVVRSGNPKQIKDWPDLIKPGVTVITPNPKTSGNGKLSFLAAWGSVVRRGGSESDAQEFVTRLYRQVPVLDPAARAATSTFVEKQIGDVHLTWENEARLEVRESRGSLAIVYPPVSIQAEPRVAVVDANVDRHGTREAAEAYLRFLYTDQGQEIIARNFYRPMKPDVLRRFVENFPPIDLFSINDVADSWAAADGRFFAEGGIFDQIYQPRSR
jgi:sulfate transport system substrate-binding protein